MSLSLTSALARNGKGEANTFDSDNWYLNKSITREAHKAVFTRQRNPIIENSRITQAIADSGSRASENILLFARGINPMVSVQYTNSDGTPSKLPYTILRDGAFRPPIRMQEELLPLSRLPRNTVTVGTNAAILLTNLPPQQPQIGRELTNSLKFEMQPALGIAPEKAPAYFSYDRLEKRLPDMATNGTRINFQAEARPFAPHAQYPLAPKLIGDYTVAAPKIATFNDKADGDGHAIPQLPQPLSFTMNTNTSEHYQSTEDASFTRLKERSAVPETINAKPTRTQTDIPYVKPNMTEKPLLGAFTPTRNQMGNMAVLDYSHAQIDKNTTKKLRTVQ